MDRKDLNTLEKQYEFLFDQSVISEDLYESADDITFYLHNCLEELKEKKDLIKRSLSGMSISEGAVFTLLENSIKIISEATDHMKILTEKIEERAQNIEHLIEERGRLIDSAERQTNNGK